MKKKKSKKTYRSARHFIEAQLRDPEIRVLFEEERARTQIAEAVRSARLRAGLTQVELAKLADTTQGVISRIEAGNDCRTPSLTLLARIAGACRAKLMFGFHFGNKAA